MNSEKFCLKESKKDVKKGVEQNLYEKLEVINHQFVRYGDQDWEKIFIGMAGQEKFGMMTKRGKR